MLNRREFLQFAAATGPILAYPSLGWAKGAAPPKTLVFLHLRGGNDGLNTVIPFANPRYRELRPTIGIDKNRVIKLGADLGLHPALGGFSAQWKKQRLAIVNGVGYPKPNYSHFRATEIWYTADPVQPPKHGWLGRALEAGDTKAPLRAVCLGKERPLSFNSSAQAGTATLTDFSRFRVPKSLNDVAALYEKAKSKPGELGKVGQAGSAALKVARRISRLRPAGGPYYGRLGQTLRKVLALIEAKLPLEIIQIDFGGFDTHANQSGSHNRLLAELGNNLNAYQNRLEQLGIADQVTTVVFSEFGRRAAENISGGTDHGSAGPVFILGKGVKPGFHGAYPSLDDLDRGNFKYTTDFRRIYADLSERVLQVSPDKVLPTVHKPLGVFA